MALPTGLDSANGPARSASSWPAYLTTCPVSVARLTGSPVVPMFTVGTRPDGLRVVFEERIVPDPTVDPRQGLNRMVSRYVERLEHHVRENAACWQLWFEQDAFARAASLRGGTLTERDE